MSTPDLIETGDIVSIGRRRHWLALEALGEARGLCDLLRLATTHGSTEEMQIVRGLSIRMGNLIDAVTSAIADSAEQTTVIADSVGIALPSQEGDA